MDAQRENNESYFYLLELNMTTNEVTPQFSRQYHIFRLIETYFVPFICSLGLICNILAVLTFLRRDLRRHSCSVFLITRSISDSLFLFNLAVIYISHTFDYQINTAAVMCQLLNFMAYVSAFISVWSVILVTCENYIRILYPFQTKQLCTPKNATICVIILFIIALCVYHVSLWISNENCSPSAEFIEITQAFVYTDTVLTLIIPTIFLSFLIIAIFGRIIQTHKKREKMGNSTINTRLVSHSKVKKNKGKMAAVTKMLLAVSLTFFILTVPSHIVRIKILIGAFVRGYMLTSNTDAALQGFAQLVYYTSMSVNLFIYLIFGDNFRRVFIKVFFSGSTSTDTDKENRHVTPFSQSTAQYDDEITNSCKISTV